MAEYYEAKEISEKLTFNKNDHNRHYDIKEKDGYLFKKYHFDYSLMSAIDEFVRFFIFLDIFMQESNMV